MRKRFFVFTAAVLLGGAVTRGEPARISPPVLRGRTVPMPTWGDARSVALLAGLLTEKDPCVRERACLELGQTHNPAALPYLQRVQRRDPSPAVRAAAIRGAVELGPAGEAVVLAGLSDPADAPLLAAMDGAAAQNQQQNLRQIVAALKTLVRHKRELIRCRALQTLTAMRQPVERAEGKRLLGDSSPAVLVEALRNALLLERADELRDDFARLAGSEFPAAVRAAAVECLGRFFLSDTFPAATAESRPVTQPTTSAIDPWSDPATYAKLAQESNPLLRRAVVNVYRCRGGAERLVPFLEDAFPLVRLAAAEALADRPTPQALAPLFRVFLEAPDPKLHRAARSALRRIGGAALGRTLAEKLPVLCEELEAVSRQLAELQKQIGALAKTNVPGASQIADPKILQQIASLQEQLVPLVRRRKQLQRNALSCCRLLGMLKRPEGLEEILKLTTKLPLDSPILAEAAVALGRIGDRRAIPPLRAVLEASARQAPEYLRAVTSMGAPPPFSEKVTGRVIQALATLGDEDQKLLDTLVPLFRLRVMMLRLETVIAYSIEVFPLLADGTNRSTLEALLREVLRSEMMSPLAQWHAARAAGELKVASVLPELERILRRDRRCLALMTAAAWAIQEITGKTPDIPEPVLRQGAWILTQMRE